MFAFIVRRLAQAALVMVTVALISFMLFQYVGDPVVFLLGQDATQEQIRDLRQALGLDQPFIVQFWHFLQNAAQGEVLAWECLVLRIPPLRLAQTYHLIMGKLTMRADAMLAGLVERGGSYVVKSRTADAAAIEID